MSEDQHISFYPVIIKYLINEATSEERVAVETFQKEHPADFDSFVALWNNTGIDREIAAIDVAYEWNKLSNAAFKPATFSLKPVLQIAAILVALIGIGLFVAKNTFSAKQETLFAESVVSNVSLPDGSQVAINNNSSITYSKAFSGEYREVSLKGDAFFQVERNESKPFVVKTPGLDVKVLGTSFYVDAHSFKNYTTVVVEKGSVSVKSAESEVLLKAGDRATFNKESGKLVKSINKNTNYLSWKTGKLIFKEQPLEHVVDELNEIYNAKIVITEDSLKSFKITTTFDNSSLELILQVLEQTLDLQVVKDEDAISLSPAS